MKPFALVLSLVALGGFLSISEPAHAGSRPSPKVRALAKVGACARDWVQRKWDGEATPARVLEWMERAHELSLTDSPEEELRRLAAACREALRAAPGRRPRGALPRHVAAQLVALAEATPEDAIFVRAAYRFMAASVLPEYRCASAGVGANIAIGIGYRAGAGVAVCRGSDGRILLGPEFLAGMLYGLMISTDVYYYPGSQTGGAYGATAIGLGGEYLDTRPSPAFRGIVFGVGATFGVQGRADVPLIRLGQDSRVLAGPFLEQD